MVRDEPSTKHPADEGWARSRFTGLPDGPLGDADLQRWPFGIGAVETRDGITFFHSRHPDGFTPDDLRRSPRPTAKRARGVAAQKHDNGPGHRTERIPLQQGFRRSRRAAH